MTEGCRQFTSSTTIYHYSQFRLDWKGPIPSLLSRPPLFKMSDTSVWKSSIHKNQGIASADALGWLFKVQWHQMLTGESKDSGDILRARRNPWMKWCTFHLSQGFLDLNASYLWNGRPQRHPPRLPESYLGRKLGTWAHQALLYNKYKKKNQSPKIYLFKAASFSVRHQVDEYPF